MVICVSSKNTKNPCDNQEPDINILFNLWLDTYILFKIFPV